MAEQHGRFPAKRVPTSASFSAEIDALAKEVAPSPTVTVSPPPPRRGPMPGEAIRRSGHKSEIDHMLFVERMSYPEVSRQCMARWNLYVHRDQIERYAKYNTRMGISDILVTPGSVGLTNVEETVRADWQFLTLIERAAMRKIRLGDVSVKDGLRAVEIRQKMLGEHSAVRMITSEEINGKGLQAILRAITEICDPDTLRRLQDTLMADQDFLAALHAAAGGNATAALGLDQQEDTSVQAEEMLMQAAAE